MSSKRRLRRNQCGEKQRFEIEAAARAAIGSLRRARDREGVPLAYLATYRCHFCRFIHYGHPPRRRQRRRAALDARGRVFHKRRQGSSVHPAGADL